MATLVAHSSLTPVIMYSVLGELGVFSQLALGVGGVSAHFGSTNGGGITVNFAGTFQVTPSDGLIVPAIFTGTVTSFSAVAGGQTTFTLTGLNVSLTELITSPSNIIAVERDIFRGNDT